MSRKIITAAVLAMALLLSACGAAAPAATPTAEPRAETAAPAAVPSSTPSAEPTAAPTVEPTAEPTPAPSAAYDTAAYEAAVEALLAEYRMLSYTEPAEFRQEEHPEIPWYSLVHYLQTRDFGEKLCYGFHDFDGNGVPELVMALGENRYPLGIYAFDGSALRYLCPEQALGERARLGLTEDGSFIVHGSGGAASGGVIVYRIGADGFSTDIQSWYEYEYQPDGSVRIENYVGQLRPEDFDAESIFVPFAVDMDYTELPLPY